MSLLFEVCHSTQDNQIHFYFIFSDHGLKFILNRMSETLSAPRAERKPNHPVVGKVYNRGLDKRGYWMITEGYFFLFLIETICCDRSSEPS